MKHGRTRFLSQRVSLWRVFFTAVVLGTMVFGAATIWVVLDVKQDLEASLPSVEILSREEGRRITRILSSDGKLVATLFKRNYKPVSYDQLGENVVHALTAIEDRRFFEHDGVDYRAVMRAALSNVMSGTIEQGASTITMQLARHLYLSDERSYERKILEVLLARKIEQSYDKKEILTLYLNEVYFGSGAHGIGAAANRYYGKAPSGLSVDQAALVAGLIQSPTYLNPLINHRGARHRQIEVLTAMRDLDHITDLEFRQAVSRATREDFRHVSSGQPMLKYPYFTSYAAHKLLEELGEKSVYAGGLTVRTTLDREMQDRVQFILRDVIESQGSRYNVHTAAAVVIENETGYIRALVGGLRWRPDDQFNRAWQAERQAGSAFKPFVYTAALELGYTQDSILNDKATSYKIDEGNGRTTTWTPKNNDGSERAVVPLRDALRLSLNQATVDLSFRIGLSRLIDLAQRMGIESRLPRVPSLALGTGTVTPLEMAQAYTVFPNEGLKRETTSLVLVTDPSGQKISDHRYAWSHQATSPEVAQQMTDMLRRVVLSGTGTGALLSGLDVAGKTGTTDGFRDAWFVGFTPRYTVAVWMGNDDNSPTWQLYGGSLPATAWRKIVESLDHGKQRRFHFLAGTPQHVQYCTQSHKRASAHCKKTTTVDFRATPPSSPECTSCEVKPPRPFKFDITGPDLLEVRLDYPTTVEQP